MMKVLQKINGSLQRQWWSVLVLSTILISTTFAFAQTNTKKKTTANLKSKVAKMSDKAKLKDLGAKVTSFRTIHNQIIDRLREAREREDLLAVDCLQDKLLRIRALMLLAESSRSNFLEHLSKKNAGKANQEYIKILQAHGKVKDLEVEASQCRGRTGVFDGKTKVEFEIPPKITKGSPTVAPWKEPIIYRPADASRFY